MTRTSDALRKLDDRPVIKAESYLIGQEGERDVKLRGNVCAVAKATTAITRKRILRR